MDHTLTRDAKKVLATIYKAYKSRRANGEAKSSAVYFDTESHDAAAIDAAVSDSLAELSNAKYVKTDICGNYTLTDSAAHDSGKSTPRQALQTRRRQV